VANHTSITETVARASEGDARAAASLLPVVYEELRRIAASCLSRESRGDQTLQPTALVHEAYLRLIGNDQRWKGRAHFLAAAAVAMRRVLVDRARRKTATKRGGGSVRVRLDAEIPKVTRHEVHALELDELLERLRELDARKSRVAEMHLFGGMTFEQIGQVLDISRSVAAQDWGVARAWLAAELEYQ
jgi:RNA polymerase sigma factor (TIGR02999 family)